MGKINRAAPLLGAVLSFGLFSGPASAETGESLFKGLCAACHTIGGGRLVGPDLKGVTERRDADWLAKFVKSPKAVIDSGDKVAKAMLDEYKTLMPDPAMTDAQIGLVLTYLGDMDSGKAGAQAAAGGKGGKGDKGGKGASDNKGGKANKPAPKFEATPAQIELGRNLFQGTTRLENGGPPCNSCHDVVNDAVIGGGVLAKELTTVFGRLGEPGVRAILGNAPFPVMGQAYEDRPLVDSEIVALVGFLQDSDREKKLQQPRDYGVKLAGTGAVGVVLLLGLYTAFWSRRKKASVYTEIYDRQIKSSDL